MKNDNPKSPARETAARNLSLAFEAQLNITVDVDHDTIKLDSVHQQLPSPNSVIITLNDDAPLHQPQEQPPFDLCRDLSLHLTRRVSSYSVLHDVNKEATALANRDPSANKAASTLVLDEEAWLLQTIANASEESCRSADTFSQAMGEQESRTQLWKPSRSWWEAKSGKNPWMEPFAHNQRWRYLWPLIHYHKFLAKCIKKLKRNCVDVKFSVSPIAVFLREEVCAVSDHLAALSLLDADQWKAGLRTFIGWTEDADKDALAALPLRTLEDPAYVDSPLLRSLIDESSLRAMAKARFTKTDDATKPSPEKRQPRVPQPARWRCPRGWNSRQQQMPCYGVPTDPAYMYQPHPHYYPYQQAPGYDVYYHPDSHTPVYEMPPTNQWVDPAVMYAMHMQQQQQQVEYYSHGPPSIDPVIETPTKSTDVSVSSQSPFWSHLHQATGAIVSSPVESLPSTPRQATGDDGYTAQPLLIQPHYGYVYGPPSPATQFMMSPPSSNWKLYSPSKKKKQTSKDRESPSTVASTAVTESAVED